MVFDFLRRNSIPVLRKEYDRVRERIDRLSATPERLTLLRLLDQVEPTLIALEEQEQPQFEKRRMMSYVREGVHETRDLLIAHEQRASRVRTQPPASEPSSPLSQPVSPPAQPQSQ